MTGETGETGSGAAGWGRWTGERVCRWSGWVHCGADIWLINPLWRRESEGGNRGYDTIRMGVEWACPAAPADQPVREGGWTARCTARNLPVSQRRDRGIDLLAAQHPISTAHCTLHTAPPSHPHRPHPDPRSTPTHPRPRHRQLARSGAAEMEAILRRLGVGGTPSAVLRTR